MTVQFFNVDIEPTNRCNAHCYFCPRDQTPHQGLMSPEVFDKALERTIEFREFVQARYGAHMKVNLCGLGEPLLNKHTPEFVEKIRAAGFECSVSTNGSLLDERRATALLEAGLQGAEINVGEEGEDYERIYGLPFDKTCEYVTRFAEMAGDRCQVRIVLVNHRRDREHVERMKDFWRERGLKQFLPFEVMNRGGTLFVDEMQYANFGERRDALALLEARGVQPVCPVPFMLPFIGYDGQFYLCCSDWTKAVPFGSVFETSFVEIAAEKLERVSTREPICKNCNHDPVNELTDRLRGGEKATDESIVAYIDALAANDAEVRGVAIAMQEHAPAGGKRPRRLIPISPDSD
jgi:MoaA/NifB/PqqE/SkfB family radical SAM enzyme